MSDNKLNSSTMQYSPREKRIKSAGFIIVTPLLYGLLLGTWEFTGLFACLGALFSVFFQIIRDWIV